MSTDVTKIFRKICNGSDKIDNYFSVNKGAFDQATLDNIVDKAAKGVVNKIKAEESTLVGRALKDFKTINDTIDTSLIKQIGYGRTEQHNAALASFVLKIKNAIGIASLAGILLMAGGLLMNSIQKSDAQA